MGHFLKSVYNPLSTADACSFGYRLWALRYFVQDFLTRVPLRIRGRLLSVAWAVVHNDMLPPPPLYQSRSLGMAAATALRYIWMSAQNVGLIPHGVNPSERICVKIREAASFWHWQKCLRRLVAYILGSNALRKNDKRHKIKLSRKHKLL